MSGRLRPGFAGRPYDDEDGRRTVGARCHLARRLAAGVSPLKVVDLSQDIAGGFATKLLAMAGLRVVRPSGPEPPAGHPLSPQVVRTYLHAGKEDSPAPRDLVASSIIEADDIVFTTFDRGRYATWCVEGIPSRCVHVTTSAFGMSGSYSGWRGGPAAEWAAGGYLAITGDPGQPPLAGPETACGYIAGYTAAIAAEAALRQRGRTGRGQHADISAMESMLSVHQSTFSRLAVGIVRVRTGRYTEVYPLTVRPCRDGHVSLGVVTDSEFDRLVIAMGREDLVADPRFSDPASRWQHRDDLDRELDAFLSSHDADRVVDILTAHGVAVAKVVGPFGVTTNPQLEHRGFWIHPRTPAHTACMPGNPVPAATRFPSDRQPPASTPGCPPRSPDLPLAGVTVLDFTAFWAGPSATRWLADLGARVIWIERPGSRAEADWDTMDATARVMHAFHLKMNRNKQSAVLDLTQPPGQQMARRLAAGADILVENFRPGIMENFGLGARELCEVNPRLVYVSLSGFGNEGPWSGRRSYGPTIEAASSIEGRTGYPGGAPLRLGHTLPDGAGGLGGALAALRGLRERDASGAGGWFDVSQLEVYAAISGEDILASTELGRDLPRIGNRSRHGAVQGVFPCEGEDEWVAIRLTDPSEVARLGAIAGLPELTDAVGDEDVMDKRIGSYTRVRGKQQVAAELQSEGLEAFPVLKPPELARDDHLCQRGFFLDVPFRGTVVRLPGSPLHSDPPLVDPGGPAPGFGEHTGEVLTWAEGTGPTR